jgi:twitching motility protein PilT
MSNSDINLLLNKAVNMRASDIHIKVGIPPIVRVNGKLKPMPDEPKLTTNDTVKMALSIMNQKQREEFKKSSELDLAYSILGLARFRCNVFLQRGTVGIVFRVIPFEILTIEELNLPIILKKIAMEERGLILVTGTTGSGKSTTLAAMIDFINNNKNCHVMTIEDPIEMLHKDKKCIINQREIGADTEAFARALRAALRQDPDVILVGEMRDFETIQTALTAAETGHLVMSTLHTLDTVETINRIISVFPPYQHKQIRIQLASVLKSVISMRLVPRIDGKGRAPAAEILVSTATIRDCIVDPEKTKLIHEYIAQGTSEYGMQTFDQSLYMLYKENLISYEEALRQSSNPDDFALKAKGIQSTSDIWNEHEKSEKREESRINRF